MARHIEYSKWKNCYLTLENRRELIFSEPLKLILQWKSERWLPNAQHIKRHSDIMLYIQKAVHALLILQYGQCPHKCQLYCMNNSLTKEMIRGKKMRRCKRLRKEKEKKHGSTMLTTKNFLRKMERNGRLGLRSELIR